MQLLDLEDPVDLGRLRSAAESSVRKMQRARRLRMDMLQRMVGPHYPGTDDAPKVSRPVNLLELEVDILQRFLASHNPQALVETDYEELLPTAQDFEIVLNRRITKIKLKDSLNICAIEALFSVGVMCIGVAVEDEYDAGCVFAEPVLFPDLILDMTAKSWDQQGFMGHKFLVPLDWVASHPDMDPKARTKFVKYAGSSLESKGEDWSRSGEDRYEDLVELEQLYIPRQKRIVLIAPEGPTDALLNTEWTGPEIGPYPHLEFRKVPGNLFPLTPMVKSYDLDDFVNKSYRKIFRQSLREKFVGLASNPDDAQAVTNASDGEVVSVTGGDPVREQKYGGASQSLIAAANLGQQLHDRLAGNLGLLGGLAPSSGTVGQDQLLAQGANGRMKDMQQTMVGFETEVVSSIAHWVWGDPIAQDRFTKKLAGTSYGIPAVWSPEARKGEFYQLNLSVNPYAQVKRSPSEQAAFITEILERVVLPSLPYMQPGSPIDWEYFYKMLARYNNAPEINMLLNWPNGDSIPQGMPEQPGKPNNTTRRYERVNTQGGARDPLAAAMEQAIASAGASQNGQMQPAMS